MPSDVTQGISCQRRTREERRTSQAERGEDEVFSTRKDTVINNHFKDELTNNSIAKLEVPGGRAESKSEKEQSAGRGGVGAWRVELGHGESTPLSRHAHSHNM